MPEMKEAMLMSQIEQVIFESINLSGKSVYAVAKESGVNHSILSRFLRRECRLSISTADVLCKYFGLSLVKV